MNRDQTVITVTIDDKEIQKIINAEVATTESSDAISPLTGYADMTKISGYSNSSIIACLNNGIVTRKTASTIAPKDNITRAEVAVIIERLLQKSELI